MAKAYKCDRCGKYHDEKPDERWMVAPKANIGYVDFCEACYSEFEEWMLKALVKEIKPDANDCASCVYKPTCDKLPNGQKLCKEHSRKE